MREPRRGSSPYSTRENRGREARPAAIEPFGLELSSIETTPKGEPVLRNMTGIKFREAGQVYDADAGERRYSRGDTVVIETKKGLALGYIAVASERMFSPGSDLRVVRRIGPNDLRQISRNSEREEDAFRFCLVKVRERGLKMKLIRTEILHGGNKAIFYFSADGRVDFRELVKDLAYKLHLRIEMRQVGVRDEAKLVGGVGACGRELCCSTWLKDFAPVSLKMAKDQNLALNPQKVSGVCGRLMCCLSYEEDTYRELRRALPRVGRLVMTPKGEGYVHELDVLRQRVRVSFAEFSETFPIAELRLLDPPNAENTNDLEQNEQRQREERRQRSRRMLERRGIIDSSLELPAVEKPVVPDSPKKGRPDKSKEHMRTRKRENPAKGSPATPREKPFSPQKREPSQSRQSSKEFTKKSSDSTHPTRTKEAPRRATPETVKEKRVEKPFANQEQSKKTSPTSENPQQTKSAKTTDERKKRPGDTREHRRQKPFHAKGGEQKKTAATVAKSEKTHTEEQKKAKVPGKLQQQTPQPTEGSKAGAVQTSPKEGTNPSSQNSPEKAKSFRDRRRRHRRHRGKKDKP